MFMTVQRIGVLEVLASGALGGAAAHVRALALKLDAQRFEVHVACSDEGPLLPDLAAAGVAIHPLSITGGFDPRAIAHLARIVRRTGIEIVHAHGTTAGLAGMAAARIARVASLYTVHGWACHPSSGPLVSGLARIAERQITHLADAVICVSHGDLSEGFRQSLVNPARSRVIADGVDPAVFDASSRREEKRRELGLGPSSKAIGVIGRLTRQKGQRILLAAAPGILARHPEAIIILVGAGEDRIALSAQAARLGLADKVVFAGIRRDIPDVMAALDAFVLPSYWEAMPLALLEAMAAARPVIATTVHGSAEVVIDNETGLLVPPGDPPALAAAICRVLGDRTLATRLGQAARLEIRQRFDVHETVQAIGSLYEALVAGRRVHA